MSTTITLPDVAITGQATTMYADHLEQYSLWTDRSSESARTIIRLMDRTDALMADSVMDINEADIMRKAIQSPISSVTGKRLPTID